MTIKERLTRLERKNRRLTLALLLAGLASAAGCNILPGDQTRFVPTEVKANQFTLVDGNGKPRAILNVDKDGPTFGLLDENGKPRAGLGVGKDGPVLALFHENGNPRAGLGVSKYGPRLALCDESGKERVSLSADKQHGPALILYDENGGVLRRLP